MSLRIEAEATQTFTRSGDWVGIRGRVFRGGEPIKTAEVWLLINGKYVKCIPQTIWHHRFWFSARFGAGRYSVQVEGYKIMEEIEERTDLGLVRVKKEHKIRSVPIEIVCLPNVLPADRMLPKTAVVENWREVPLSDGVIMANKIVDFTLQRYSDTKAIYLVGEIINRGWTKRDLDIFIISKQLFNEDSYRSSVLDRYYAPAFQNASEKLINYPTSIFVSEGKPPFGCVYQLYPENILQTPELEKPIDERVLYHGTIYRKARTIQRERSLRSSTGLIHLTTDKREAVNWARRRAREKRNLGWPAVVSLSIPQQLSSQFMRYGEDLTFFGPELPIRDVKVEPVGWFR